MLGAAENKLNPWQVRYNCWNIWVALTTQYSPWPLRVSCSMIFLCPTLGEWSSRRRRQSSDTALSTTRFSESLRWSFADAQKVSNSLVLEAAIFLAMTSWSSGGRISMAWRRLLLPCGRREDAKERTSGFGGEQEGNKTFYNGGEKQLFWKEAKKHKCLEIVDN